MPTITVYPPRGAGVKPMKIFVPVCPDCRGSKVVIWRTGRHGRNHLRPCPRCKEAP